MAACVMWSHRLAVTEQPAGAWHAGSDSPGCMPGQCPQLPAEHHQRPGPRPTRSMDSPITGLIVQMLRAPQQGAFQVLLATILGLLVRHCTFIPC